jgi:hypothetical protein
MFWTTPTAGWVFVNIVLPLMLPFAGIVAVGLAPSVPKSNVLNQVKDGQLNWLAAGLCATALYEQHEATNECLKYVLNKTSPGDLIPFYWDWLFGFLIGSLCIAFLLASLGAVFITSIRTSTSPDPWWKYYKMFSTSILVTAAAVVQATVVHATASPGCSIYSAGFHP